MFFQKQWLLGACFHLESFRRGFVGGSALALFIIKEFGLERQAVPTMEWMRTYLDFESELLAQIPAPLSFLLTPFTDYHEAAELYLRILAVLAESQRPPTCEFYWKEQ